MKRALSFLVLLSIFVSAWAQDVQLHYDFVRAAQVKGTYFTSTVEYLGTNQKGTTYFFIDMDYSSDFKGVKLTYWEISRDQTLWNLPFQLHVEYTAGNLFIDTTQGMPISRSYIFGINFPFTIGKMYFGGAFLLRKFAYTKRLNYQFTGVWDGDFLNNKITIDGFIDIWTEENLVGNGLMLKVLTEPQFWYNINKTFAVGSEIEISRNFIAFDNKFHVLPTVAIKWNLKNQK